MWKLLCTQSRTHFTEDVSIGIHAGGWLVDWCWQLVNEVFSLFFIPRERYPHRHCHCADKTHLSAVLHRGMFTLTWIRHEFFVGASGEHIASRTEKRTYRPQNPLHEKEERLKQRVSVRYFDILQMGGRDSAVTYEVESGSTGE